MTVIVALKDGKKVWMGGDRYRSQGPTSYSGTNPKIWKKVASFGNNWIFGECGSTDLQLIAQYRVKLPEINPLDRKDLCEFLFNEYIPKLQEQVRSSGQATKDPKGAENMNGSLILGLCGEIFNISGFAVTQIERKFFSKGLGEPAATAALYIMEHHKINLSPSKKIRSATHATECYYPVIGGGVDIIHS